MIEHFDKLGKFLKFLNGTDYDIFIEDMEYTNFITTEEVNLNSGLFIIEYKQGKFELTINDLWERFENYKYVVPQETLERHFQICENEIYDTFDKIFKEEK